MSKKNNPKTIPYNVQIDETQLQTARKAVNLPSAVRDLVSRIVKRKICPTCNRPLSKAAK